MIESIAHIPAPAPGARAGSVPAATRDLRRQLEGLYARALYRVRRAGGWRRIRVGARNPGLDAMLVAFGARRWVFITAYNPASTPLPGWRNVRRDARLRVEMRRGGWRLIRARSEGPGWPAEWGWWVPHMGRAQAWVLGRRYGQAAVVCGVRGGLAELVWCDGGSAVQGRRVPWGFA